MKDIKEPLRVDIAQYRLLELGKLTEAVYSGDDVIALCGDNQDNAKRIVACVNYLAGMPTEEIIRKTNEKRNGDSIDAITVVKQQRDRLLRFLKKENWSVMEATALIKEIEENK
jgi:hypothetical protein